MSLRLHIGQRVVLANGDIGLIVDLLDDDIIAVVRSELCTNSRPSPGRLVLRSSLTGCGPELPSAFR